MNFIKKETLAQLFSCEFCEISKDTFFTEHLLPTASEMLERQFCNYTLWTFYLKFYTIFTKTSLLDSEFW